jgi:hypothetical protein
MNFPRVYNKIPFNKEIIRLVKKWEQYHNIKFTGKILPSKTEWAYFDYKNIYLPYCSKQTLLHELQHVLQQKRGLDVKRFTHNYHCHLYPIYRNIDMYFNMPTERDANRQAKILNKTLK